MNIRFFILVLMVFVFGVFMAQTPNKINKQVTINPAGLAGSVLYIDLNLLPKGCLDPRVCGTSCCYPCGTSCGTSCNPCSCCDNDSCNECRISKSLEFTNLYDCFIKASKDHEKMRKHYTDLLTELHNQYNKGLINNVAYTTKITELQDKFNKLTEKESATSQSFFQAIQNVEQKLIVIGKRIAKNLGASALESLEERRQIYVDPTYDITKTAIDQLNDDYING